MLKRVGLVVTAVMGAALCAVPMHGQAKAGAVDDQNKYSNGSTSGPQLAKDRLFLHSAAEGGLGMVELGKLAVAKASSPDVKALAQTIVDDHTKLNASFQPIAQALQASPAKKMGKQDQAEFAKLSGLSGADFDKEYLAFMIKEHKKDQKDFDLEMSGTDNGELKNSVAIGQGLIAQHLATAQKLAAANGVTG